MIKKSLGVSKHKTTIFNFIVSLIFIINSSNALTAEPINFATIQKFAELSSATYATDAVTKTELEKYQYKLVRFDTIPTLQVRYIVADHADDNIQLIAMRGTSNLENAYIDIDFKMEPDDTLGIKLHKGFAASAREIYKQLKPTLNKDTQYELTGHSLGGALAVIVGMFLDNDGFKISSIYTYGQPKVTNVFGSRKFSHLPLYRIVTSNDLVPLVPPLDPLDLMKLDIYWHSGREIILFPDNVYAELEGADSVMRALGIVQDTLSEKNIMHHLMDTYLSKIKPKIPGAELLPFDLAKQRFKSIPLPGNNSPSSGRVLPL